MAAAVRKTVRWSISRNGSFSAVRIQASLLTVEKGQFHAMPNASDMRKLLHVHSWVLWVFMAVAAVRPASEVSILDRDRAIGAYETRTGDLACNDTILITLDEQCRALISPDMLLEGDMGCLTSVDFTIDIYDASPANGPQIDGSGLFKYEIRYSGESTCETPFTECSGYIRAEDKTLPVVHCPDPVRMAGRSLPVQQLLGDLANADEQLSLTGPFCGYPEEPLPAGDRFFDLFRFEVTAKTVFTFEVSLSSGTPLAALYQEAFHPDAPCKRLLKVARPAPDQSGFFAQSGAAPYVFSIELLPGREYILLTSSQEAGLVSNYNWAIYHQGGGKIAGLIERPERVLLPLFCANVDSVLHRPATTAILGMASADDNCSLPERTSIIDRLRMVDDCEDRVIERQFSFRDKSGNTASCTQTITFRQARLTDVVLPPARAYVPCDEAAMLDEAGSPPPMLTGRPYLPAAFGPLFLEEAVRCGLGATYRDVANLELCGDTRQINRIWTLIDWCRGEEKLTFSQTIIVGDYVGPSMVLPGTNSGAEAPSLRFSTGPFSCFAAFEVPLPTQIKDNCSDNWELEVTVLEAGGDLIAHFGPDATDYQVSGVPTGQHTIRYLLRDACGNETARMLDFLVADAIDPVAVCTDSLHVSIGGEGRGSLRSEDVDEGSWDNCDKDVALTIRRSVAAECVDAYREQVDTMLTFDESTGRYYTPWREKLDFLCCEIGREVLVELRATDDGLLSNTCWLRVRVEDKAPPRCVAPPAASIFCDTLNFIDYTDTMALREHFGLAQAEDNCSAEIQELEAELELDNCGAGTLLRRFQSIDGSGNRSAVCSQRIELIPRNHYEIKFPRDAPFYTCSIGEVDSLELRELACDLLAVSRDTTFFESDADECYKMHIDYRVINWCEYEEGQGPLRIGRDEDGDGVPGDEAVYVLRRPAGPDSTYIDNNNDERDGFFRTLTSVGYWHYQQAIKVYDNEAPIIEVAPFSGYFCALNDCFATVDILFDVLDACTTRELDYELVFDEGDNGDRTDLDASIYIKGRFPKQRINGEFPIGQHAFYLTATDGCGNSVTERIPFEVVDCKSPAPVCIERLAVELMALDVDGDGAADTGANTVWATDFIASEGSDCTGVRYSVNRVGALPHPDSQSISITCEDPEELFVNVYAWDDAFNPEAIQPDGTLGGPNYSHCIARIFVQDNRFDLCGRSGSAGAVVAGAIFTETREPVTGVSVQLSGRSSQAFFTDERGTYRFEGIQAGYDYSIVPGKEEQPLNGLTTFDLLLISKHILGVKHLDSPYKMLAADINRSGSITTIDLIQARKMILGVLRDFPNNHSWRFVRADHPLELENPWNTAVPELVNINDFSDQDRMNYDFVAVKVGDVNGNAQANELRGAEPRQRAGVLRIHTADRQLETGADYRVELRTDDLAGIEGYQFTLDFDPALLELRDVGYGVLQEGELGWRFLDQGMITASWHSAERQSLSGGAVLLTLTFRARSQGRLSDHLRLNSRFTPAEAYDRRGDLLDVVLHFDTVPAPTLHLYQNRPNPFREHTLIAFQLPEPERVVLLIHDLSGRLLWRHSGQYPAGYQEVAVKGAELPGQGVLLYTLQTKNRAVSRRMVRIE